MAGGYQAIPQGVEALVAELRQLRQDTANLRKAVNGLGVRIDGATKTTPFATGTRLTGAIPITLPDTAPHVVTTATFDIPAGLYDGVTIMAYGSVQASTGATAQPRLFTTLASFCDPHIGGGGPSDGFAQTSIPANASATLPVFHLTSWALDITSVVDSILTVPISVGADTPGALTSLTADIQALAFFSRE